jgi:hypothetical protein
VTSETLQLADGRRLANNRGSWRLDPGGETVDVVIGDGVVTILDPDTGQVLADQVPVAEDKQGHGKASRLSTPSRSTNDARRWAAYNQFVDVIAPRLSLAEQAIWQSMFRNARDGVCTTSARRLADSVGVNKATASRAIQTLERFELVRPLWKSTDKSKASRYGMHPRPADCLPKVIAADDARRQAAAKRKEDHGGDRPGTRRPSVAPPP